MLSKPAYDWKGPDRYVELLNFKMEVANVWQTQAYDLNDSEKVSILKNWLGKEGLQFIQTLANIEKGACKSTIGLFSA